MECIELGCALHMECRWEEFLGGYLGPTPERYTAEDVYELLAQNLHRIKGKLRIMSGCGTLDREHLPVRRPATPPPGVGAR